MYFFPVDNTKDLEDPVIRQLMKEIESVIDESDYIKELKPLSYFKVLDTLNENKHNCITYDELKVIADSCGVAATQVDKMLEYLHDMGCLMWHKEEGLRDFVIIDPISYFVGPAARVVCNHSATKDDATIHRDVILDKCRHRPDFKNMVDKGIASKNLLQILLANDLGKTTKATIENRLLLMGKFGLVVALEPAPWPLSIIISEKFLIPALLKVSDDITKLSVHYDSKYIIESYVLFLN